MRLDAAYRLDSDRVVYLAIHPYMYTYVRKVRVGVDFTIELTRSSSRSNRSCATVLVDCRNRNRDTKKESLYVY